MGPAVPRHPTLPDPNRAARTQRRVVGHAVHNDFKVLQLLHPKSSVRDTANFAPFRTQNGPTSRARKLSDRARERLGMTIQTGETLSA